MVKARFIDYSTGGQFWQTGGGLRLGGARLFPVFGECLSGGRSPEGAQPSVLVLMVRKVQKWGCPDASF
jgi:hypothetical protein